MWFPPSLRTLDSREDVLGVVAFSPKGTRGGASEALGAHVSSAAAALCREGLPSQA